MTKRELEHAQFLWLTFIHALNAADAFDPRRLWLNPMSRRFDGIALLAAEAFVELTGRHPSRVESMIELNTEHPAEWTKHGRHSAARSKRGTTR